MQFLYFFHSYNKKESEEEKQDSSKIETVKVLLIVTRTNGESCDCDTGIHVEAIKGNIGDSWFIT